MQKTVENKRKQAKKCENDWGTFCRSFCGHFPVAIKRLPFRSFPFRSHGENPTALSFFGMFQRMLKGVKKGGGEENLKKDTPPKEVFLLQEKGQVFL